jgi:hypothetical protein
LITKSPEIAWLNRDNVIHIALSNDNVLINHTLVTRILMFFSTQTIDSAATPTLFDFSKTDYIVFKPGSSGLPLGTYTVGIVTYDSSNPDGVRWGDDTIVVKQG